MPSMFIENLNKNKPYRHAAGRRPQAAGRRVSVLCSAAVLRTLN